MIKLMSILLSIQIILFPSLVYSEEPISHFLNKNDKAPFTGILLNEEAQKKQIAEKREKEKLHELEINYLKMRSETDCKYKTDSLKLDVNSLREQNKTIIKLKDEEITKLQKIAVNNPNSNAHWWVTIGAVGGIVITIGMFLLVSQVKKVD